MDTTSSRTPFHRLWASAASTNLADGIAHLVVPVSAVTSGAEPLALAVVVTAGLLPWLHVSPVAGVTVDRVAAHLVIRVAAAVRIVAGSALLAALLYLDGGAGPLGATVGGALIGPLGFRATFVAVAVAVAVGVGVAAPWRLSDAPGA